MSRTDAHAPYWVQLHREGVISHDHRNGECDYHHPEKPQRSTWRTGRHHISRNCKKYVEYTVVCSHIYHFEDRILPGVYDAGHYHTSLTPVVTEKSHKVAVFAADGEAITRDKPLLPVCHQVVKRGSYVNKGDGFASYAKGGRDFYRGSSLGANFSFDGERFASHTYSLYLFVPDVSCGCDGYPPRWPSCSLTTAPGMKVKGYSYYCSCSWCARPAPSRSSVKQALKAIAAYGYDDELDDGYLDYEDVYRKRDYRTR